MTQKRLFTFALLAGLYLAQGLPFGFFTQAVPVFMREQGASLSVIGFTSLLALPWALKFLWAPWVDRWTFFGRRRGFIILMQSLTALALIVTAFFEPSESLKIVLVLSFVLNLFSATQDIATDGLAVENLSDKERGIGNGIQVAAYRVGMIIGGGALLITSEQWGWRPSFLLMAFILFVAGAGVFFYQDGERTLADDTSERTKPPSFLKEPGALLWLWALVLYKAFDAGASAMLRPFLKDLALSNSEIGVLVGTLGFAAGLFGALIGGALVAPLGRKIALTLFGVLQGLSILLYAFAAYAASAGQMLNIAIIADHFCGGMASAALFTIMMDRSRPGSEGADYTLQASVVVIASGSVSAFSGLFADAVGYTSHFALSGSLCVVYSVVVGFVLLDKSNYKVSNY